MTVPERVLAHLIPPRFPKHYQSHPPLASAVFWAATLATSVRSIPVHPRATYSAVKKQKTTEFEQWTIFQLLAGMFSHAIHISTHIVYQMFPIVKKRRKFSCIFRMQQRMFLPDRVDLSWRVFVTFVRLPLIARK